MVGGRRSVPWYILLILVLATPLALAEDVIYLNTGGVIKGEIIRENDTEIEVNAFGASIKVFREDIARIERDAARAIEREYKQKLEQIDDPDPKAHFELGRWLEKMKQHELAKQEFEKAVAQDEYHSGARQALGLAPKERENPDAEEGSVTTRKATFTGNLPVAVKDQLKAIISLDGEKRSAALTALRNIETSTRAIFAEDLASEDPVDRKRAMNVLIRSDKELADLKPKVVEDALTEDDEQRLQAGIDQYLNEDLLPTVATNLTGQARGLTKGLQSRYQRLIRLIDDHDSTSAEEQRQKLLEEMLERREAALEVIFDKEVYPDENHGRAGQKYVDEKVDALREVWEQVDPLIEKDVSRFVGISPQEAQQFLAEVKALEGALADISSLQQAHGWEQVRQLDRPDTIFMVLLHYRAGQINEAYELAGDELSPWEKQLLKRLRDVRVSEYNDRMISAKIENEAGKNPTGPERLQVGITNDYRIMMGREALEINLRLIATARGHSAEMTRLGYFAHESPVKERKTPSMRAAIEGYSGGVAENISMGSVTPKATHIAWYNSSGHHRNILGPGHTCMGSGQDSKHWTQNFGSRSLLKR